MKYLPLTLLLILLFSGCNLRSVHPYEKVDLNDTTYFSIQDCYNYPGGEYAVCLDSTQDSRCPIGLLCFWGGMATGWFSFTDSEGDSQSFEINLGTTDSLINGLNFSFVELSPYPDINNPYTPDEIVAKVIISQP
ncbi:MAG: hypothetical protein JW801_19220 [Bacteroidales bacterium]|nr:hypothetical protein [Bacteroidales bacterium]